MTVKNVNVTNDTINLQIGNYRLYQVTKVVEIKNDSLSCTNMPISEGINLEKRCNNSTAYYVIATVKYNKDNNVILEPVGMRMLDIENDEWDTVKKLLTFATDLLELIKNNED